MVHSYSAAKKGGKKKNKTNSTQTDREPSPLIISDEMKMQKGIIC